MFHYGMGSLLGGWGFFGIGWFFSILFWILIIWAIIALIRGWRSRDMSQTPPHPPKGEEPPLEILKRRYAKGEINKKEFEEMKKDLR